MTFWSMTLLQVMTISIATGLTAFMMVQQHRSDTRNSTVRQSQAMGPELVRLLLWDDRIELARQLEQSVQANEGLDLAFIELDGKPLVDSGSDVPAGLLGLETAKPTKTCYMVFRDHNNQHHCDFITPLGEDGHVLHLVLNRSRVDAVLKKPLLVLGGIGLLAIILGTLLAHFISFRVTRATAALNKELRETNDHLEDMNAKLQQQQAQLVMSEKMASLGQLSAGVAHEINNPIGFMMSNLNTMKEYAESFRKISRNITTLAEARAGGDSTDLDKGLETLEKIWSEEDMEYVLDDLESLLEESGDGMNRVCEIVNNLRTFARRDEEDPEPLDVNECIESTIKMVAHELKDKCTLTTDLAVVPQIMGYPGRIKQVLTNLLVNASHAIKEKGEVRVETRLEGDWVVVRISDTGSGIPKHLLPRIFDPFFTTKEVGKGPGLGLSTSHSIIADHEGSLEVISEMDKGTTFTISLPKPGKSFPETQILGLKAVPQFQNT